MTDYTKIGLKVGLEIHQQLATREKLFCACRPDFSRDRPIATVTRQLRVVSSELGTTDIAAAHEALRKRRFRYQVYSAESCLVELDEEPPHPVNSEALDTALTLSLMLHCRIPDELQIMRKQVVDGSNTAGFQRTVIIGLNGHIDTPQGRVGIPTVALEEDSAQILSAEGNTVVYGLDRLGVPLIEIGTAPDIHTPEQAREVALQLGMLLRSTEKVKRGLGTIRQDINISIAGGARIEIKGVQDLSLIPTYVEYEVQRQQNLLALRDELKAKGFRPVTPHLHTVTHIFEGAASPLTKNKPAFALVIPRGASLFSRLLTPTVRLGKELAWYVEARTNIKGFIHSDEDLSTYHLQNEFDQLRRYLKAGDHDLLIVAVGEKEVIDNAFQILTERVNRLLAGVPEETRKALPDGNTAYLRPLPGAARLYPETDIPPIRILSQAALQKQMPEPWDVKIKRLMVQYGLSHEIATQLVRSGMSSIFEHVMQGNDPVFVAAVLTSGLKELERKEQADTGKLTDDHLVAVFDALRAKTIGKEAVLPLLKSFAENPGQSLSDALHALGFTAISLEELRRRIRDIIHSHQDILAKDRPEQVYMGLVMKEMRGKVNGETIMKVLREELKKYRR